MDSEIVTVLQSHGVQLSVSLLPDMQWCNSHVLLALCQCLARNKENKAIYLPGAETIM